MINQAVSGAAYVVQASGLLGFVHLAEGRAEEGDQILESLRIDSQLMQDGFALVTRDALLVEFALRQGKIDEARRLSVGVDFDLRPPHWFQYAPQLTPLKLLLAEGTDERLKDARTRLVELDEQMPRINRKSVRIDLLALLALVCHEHGEEGAALEKLRAALDLAEPGGWVRNFVDLGTPMADLLERLIQLQPGYTYAQQVLDAFGHKTSSGRPNLASSEDNHISKSGQSAEESIFSVLTNRELDVLIMLEERLSNKEIAERLFVSPETVKEHTANIYLKLNVSGRRQAVAAARRPRLLPAK